MTNSVADKNRIGRHIRNFAQDLNCETSELFQLIELIKECERFTMAEIQTGLDNTREMSETELRNKDLTMYKTLAELKRALVPGTKLNLVQTLLGPCDKIRTVKQVRSRDMILTMEDGRDSYCTFPKAENYIPLHSGFQFIEDNRIAVHYIFI